MRRHNYRYTWRYGWRWIVTSRTPFNALKSFYWAFVRGWDGETCWFCEQPYFLWHAPDDLWAQLSGNCGLCCPQCFDKRAERAGISLHWSPERFENYLARTSGGAA